MTAIADFIREAQKNEQKITEVMESWGLKPETAKRFHIGYIDPTDQKLTDLFAKVLMEDPGTMGTEKITGPSLVIPVGMDFFFLKDLDFQIGYLARPKIGTRKYIFNEGAIYNNETEKDLGQPVFICHSIEDALTYLEADFQAIYINPRDLEELAEDLKTEPTWNGFIATYSELPQDPKDINVYRDNLKRSVIDKLKGLKVESSSLIDEVDLTKYRTPQDYYTADPKGFKDIAKGDEHKITKKALDKKAEYNAKASGPRIPQFKRYILNRPNRQAIPTGFRGLDELLDGGLYQGLYTLGAVSSLGKTAFCLQIADQIAEQGNDVLFFTLEQTPYELMARSVSRLTWLFRSQDKEGRTYRDILNKADKWDEEERNAVFRAMELYQKQTDSHIFFIHNITDIRDYTPEELNARGTDRIGPQDVEEAIRQHLENRQGSRPVVIIDYLQILEPADSKKSDKQNMDLNVSALRRITADNDLSIIAISSFNRDSYNAPVELSSFKESGIIEYSSDVVIGIQPRDIRATNGQDKESKGNKEIYTATKNAITKNLDVRILKNRHGKLGEQPFSFNGMYSFYSEGYTEDQEEAQDNDWTITTTH